MLEKAPGPTNIKHDIIFKVKIANLKKQIEIARNNILRVNSLKYPEYTQKHT